MTDDQRRNSEVVGMIRRFAPKYRMEQKTSSCFMRGLGWAMAKAGNSDFLTSYWTTIGSTTYRPSSTDGGPALNEFLVLMHEGRHVVDSQRIGSIKFSLAYLLPQLLAVPGALCALFGACVASGGLVVLGLLLLALAAPLPAPFRAWAEFRGYGISLACKVWSGKTADLYSYIDRGLTPMFTGPSYLWMWPFRSQVELRLEAELDRTKRKGLGELPFEDDYERECFNLARRYRDEDCATQPTA